MDILKRELAPIGEGAWKEIDAEVKDSLDPMLSARGIVDVGEPRGVKAAAVNLGGLTPVETEDGSTAVCGVREVLPLVEVRVPFRVDRRELERVDRGGRDPDLEDLQRAARDLAKFEEDAIYGGHPECGIEGLVPSSSFEAVTLTGDAPDLPDAVTRAMLRLRYGRVGGPYALALGPQLYRMLHAGSERGFPVLERIRMQIEGPIVFAPFLEGGVLVSRRGGDAEMTIGLDATVGYEDHAGSRIDLFLVESFAFRVLSPEVGVPITSE